MSLHGKFFGFALGTGLLFAGATYAGAQPLDRHAERQEQIARDDIRRGELMEQQGRRLESRGEWRRGEALERRGENLERHGKQLLAAAERHEHVYGYR
jgi:hypothetical protein